MCETLTGTKTATTYWTENDKLVASGYKYQGVYYITKLYNTQTENNVKQPSNKGTHTNMNTTIANIHTQVTKA
eukprot:Pgem_evm1s1457